MLTNVDKVCTPCVLLYSYYVYYCIFYRLYTMYKSNRGMQRFLRMVDGLAFLPEYLVTEGWESLVRANPYPADTGLRKFLKYKEKYYIGKRRTRVVTLANGNQQSLTTRPDPT